MNLMRFDVGTVGNHEFDEGGDELIRLLRGGRRQDAGRLKRDADGRLREYLRARLRGRAAFPTPPPTRSIARAGWAFRPRG